MSGKDIFRSCKLVFILWMTFICSCKEKSVQEQPSKIADPVCGMELAKQEVQYFLEGKTYYFCSQHCKERFEAKPADYLSGEDKHWCISSKKSHNYAESVNMGMLKADTLKSSPDTEAVTKITCSPPIPISGKIMPEDTYALFTLPGKKDKALIINKNRHQHLADEYNNIKRLNTR